MPVKERLYWLMQVGGWGLWLLNDLINYLILNPGTLIWVLEYVINVALCIGVTHAYRRYIRRYPWEGMHYRRAVVQVGLAAVVMSLILTLFNYPLDLFLLRQNSLLTLGQNNLGNFLSMWLFWGKPMLLWLAFYHIYYYFQKSREVAVEKIRIESLAREAEARVLRSQLNPHFMFNALNSIRALILEDPDRAQRGITQMSNILRSSLLADRRHTQTLDEEMRTVNDYLALEKIRYEDRLEVRRDLDPDTLQCPVPPMMVQTLVENAIKHGVSKPVRGGFVSIESRLEGGGLHLCISNTGTLGKQDSGGFGIENTERRIKLLFGEQARFHLFQSQQDVVSAELWLPAEALPAPQAPLIMKQAV